MSQFFNDALTVSFKKMQPLIALLLVWKLHGPVHVAVGECFVWGGIFFPFKFSFETMNIF